MSVTCGRLELYSIATPGGGHELPVEDEDPQEVIPPRSLPHGLLLSA